MEINQIYSAPSIPKKIKINRRNIKSSVFSSAIKPQIELKTSSFSFIKPVISLPRPELLSSFFTEKSQIFNNLKEKVIEKLIKTEVKNNITRIVKENFVKVFKEGIQKKFIRLLPRGKDSENLSNNQSILDRALFETNKIISQIQNQLSSAYKSRIDERKKELEKRKRRLSRSRAENKEKFLEGAAKLGEGINKTFAKVTSPIKSIFDKIVEFFKIILTGLILNNAFIWLSKPENREKLKKFFHFLADHWKEILIILGTAKLLGVILKVVGAARSLKKLIDLFRKNKPPGGGGPGNICNQFLNCFGNPAVVTSFSQFLSSQPRIYNTIKGIAGGTVLPPIGIPGVPPVTPGAPTRPPVRPPVGNLPTGQPALPITPPSPNLLSRVSEAIAAITGVSIGIATFIGGALLSGLISPAGATTRNPLNKFDPYNPNYGQVAKAEGGTIKEPPKKKCTACSIEKSSGFSLGGTVGKGDRPGTDMVPAMTRGGQQIRLDENEEVIRASEATRWRPLLKDVNNNGAKMWQAFVDAIKRQENNNTLDAENILEQGKILDEYDKSLKEEARRLKLKYLKTAPSSSSSGPSSSVEIPKSSTHSSPAASPSPSPAPSPAPSQTSTTPETSSGPGPISLPVQPVKDTPTPSSPAPAAEPGPTMNKNWSVGRPISEVKRIEQRYEGYGRPLTQEEYLRPTSETFGIPDSSSTKINNSISQVIQNTKKWNIANLNLSEKSPQTTFINMPLPPIVKNNQPKMNLPGPQGNPTPIPSISSVNPAFSDDIARNAIALGIVG